MLFVFDANAQVNNDALRARGDEERMEEFIRQNRRFILGCAHKTLRRFVTESDDEWSVALIAFHEAVMTYDAGKGNFKTFAGLVIRRRLLDYLDSQSKVRREISADLSGAEPEEEELTPIQLEAARAEARQAIAESEAKAAIRDEIEAVSGILQGYGISFFDLAGSSPKAQKTKDACAAVLRALLADRALMEKLRRTRALPASELCRAANVSRKILENHRKYIIASAEILDGDFPGLGEYLRYVKKGGEGK